MHVGHEFRVNIDRNEFFVGLHGEHQYMFIVLVLWGETRKFLYFKTFNLYTRIFISVNNHYYSISRVTSSAI